jgi:hypothetical protein
LGFLTGWSFIHHAQGQLVAITAIKSRKATSKVVRKATGKEEDMRLVARTIIELFLII